MPFPLSFLNFLLSFLHLAGVISSSLQFLISLTPESSTHPCYLRQSNATQRFAFHYLVSYFLFVFLYLRIDSYVIFVFFFSTFLLTFPPLLFLSRCLAVCGCDGNRLPLSRVHHRFLCIQKHGTTDLLEATLVELVGCGRTCPPITLHPGC